MLPRHQQHTLVALVVAHYALGCGFLRATTGLKIAALHGVLWFVALRVLDARVDGTARGAEVVRVIAFATYFGFSVAMLYGRDAARSPDFLRDAFKTRDLRARREARIHRRAGATP